MKCEIELKDVYDLLIQVRDKLAQQEITHAIESGRANTVELATEAAKRDPNLSFAIEGEWIIWTRQTPFGAQTWRTARGKTNVE